MFNRLDIVFDNAYNEEINYNFGSVLHGYIMERIAGYAEVLHAYKINPYSQYVYFNKQDGSYVWRIQSLTDECYEKMLLPVKNTAFDGINLRSKEKTYAVTSVREFRPVSTDDIINKAYSGNVPGDITFRFVTPCSFHSFGKSVFWPQSDLLVKSLINKADAFSGVEVRDADAIKQLTEGLVMKDYSLKSTLFYLEKVKIKSFTGTAGFYINGPDMMKSLCYMLGMFAEYSGIGVKSSMGMGAVNLLTKEK